MSVDKFGRHESSFIQEVLRGPPGEGFQLTLDGHYDLKGKRMCHVADPIHKDETATLGTIKTFTLNCESNREMFNANNKRIIHLANAENDTDAVNMKFVLNEITLLKQDIYEKIDKLQSDVIILTNLNKEDRGKPTKKESAIYNTDKAIDAPIPLMVSNELRRLDKIYHNA